jgi:sialate O-acetylesterase
MIATRLSACAAAVFATAFCARADVTLPGLFSDHMVVQRGLPVHVWGKAAPGESVTVTFRGESRSTSPGELGEWSVYLPPGSAGGPFEMGVKGTNSITVRDVMVGEVWVDSGQSNMEFALKSARNGAAEVAAANHPAIRLYHVIHKSSPLPLDAAGARYWQVSTPETAGGFSAVAYFFAREISEKQGVAVGLIDSNWGGTPVEAWMSLRALSSSAAFMPAFAEWDRMIENYPQIAARREKKAREFRQAVEKARKEGRPEPAFPWERNEENSWMPAGLWNAMIAPLVRFPIGGVIWYQGESNATTERAPLYAAMFGAMIRDWRRAWGVGDFPFLFVQLANFKTAPDAKWPELREAQLRTLSVARTGMAVAIDVGDPNDIHPTNKQDVGHRLALAARAVGFGEKIEYSGPLFRTAAVEGSSVRLWFDHADGLEARGGVPAGFEIAGADGRFVPAEARIDGATAVVSSPSVAQPARVRYAWADNPECNLYNSAKLPASPFRWGD